MADLKNIKSETQQPLLEGDPESLKNIEEPKTCLSKIDKIDREISGRIHEG